MLDVQLLGQRVPGDHAAIVVGQDDHWAVGERGAKDRFTRGIEVVAVGQGKHDSIISQGFYRVFTTLLQHCCGGSQVNLLTNVTYSGVGGAAGHITSANLANGTYSLSASYDNDLRLTSMSLLNVSLGTTLFSSNRGYDAVSNVTSVSTILANGTDNQRFCYDDLNRLVWAGATGTPSCGGTLTAGTLTSAHYTATYSYDTLNRIMGGALGTLTFGDSAHLHAATSSSLGETASYDAAGDMTCQAPPSVTTCAGSSPTGALLTYDAARQLTS